MKSKGVLYVISLILGLVCLSCDYNRFSEVKPAFSSEEPDLEPITVELAVHSEIEPAEIEPSLIRKIIRAIVGWIPGVGRLVELPIDILNALIPNLPTKDFFDLPDQVKITDPSIIQLIEEVKISEFVLESNAGEKHKKQGLDFINEIRVYLVRKDDEDKRVLLATGLAETDLVDEHRTLVLKPNLELNLKPYLARIDEYRVQMAALGKPPKYKLYLTGYIDLNVKLHIPIR